MSKQKGGTNKLLRPIIAAAREQWGADRVHLQANGHWQLRPPDKTIAPIQLPGSPSDHRSMKNTIAQLRRAGLDI